MSTAPVLHSYWRSGAAYRVRIALALKGIVHGVVAHDLRIGAQHDPGYLQFNPQGLVPVLEAGQLRLAQSLAILEWLEESWPTPPLLPLDPTGRAVVRSMAALVCCDIHPLNNLRVLDSLRRDFGADEDQVSRWIERWIRSGFDALEPLLLRYAGTCAYGDSPTIADCCLVPQVYSARRFAINLSDYPAIIAAAQHCEGLAAFGCAYPDAQPDAPGFAQE